LVSKKLFLIIFAINAKSHISDILKNAIKIDNNKITIARRIHTAFAPLLEKALKTPKEAATPTPTIKS
jgi:hypothetical protein